MGTWEFSIKFVSIASAKTCLLRNGYKFSYVSIVYPPKENLLEYHVENWFRGV